MTWEPSKVNEDLKKKLNLSVFMLGLMEGEKFWEGAVSELGKLGKACPLRFISVSPSLWR